ncbi:MAG: hypothetical protein ABIS39_03455 [Sphingomicrobium sp.]
MTEPGQVRKRKVSIGEGIALAALFVSGLGLWNNWQNEHSGPTEVVEKKTAVPLVLRGQVADDGKRIEIAPVENAHALDSLRLAFAGGKAVDVGANGMLSAGDIESALPENSDRKQDGQVSATVTTRYVEAGQEHSVTRRYAIRYRWDGGGLFGGKSLRIIDFRRA